MSLTALYAAATGMDAQQTRINDIANNLANVNTSAFKADKESFEDLIYNQVQTPGLKTSSSTVAPIGIQTGHGTRLAGVYKNFSQGEMTQTNRELDLAIEGRGFFSVTLESGEKAFTRNGALRVDSTGKIVTDRGLALDPGVTIPADATSLSIGKDGTITAVVPGSSTPSDLGKIDLVMFANESGLQSMGQNLYKETSASGTPTSVTAGELGSGTIAQGYLENSNVNVAEELINMIIAQRSYEANSKVLSTTNEMMRSTSNAIG